MQAGRREKGEGPRDATDGASPSEAYSARGTRVAGPSDSALASRRRSGLLIRDIPFRGDGRGACTSDGSEGFQAGSRTASMRYAGSQAIFILRFTEF